ncbi:hypothetical protein [Liquorilactobacillus mali]|uniref:Uncharacterized protein n=1 Tax=Liquorilactobacillus mali KCTC 3596 = DSM 20444 TaxID=1046596 RepID=A0A0R2E3A3_9LACO|nr:hypothetical protein [Liquorilactobacillus mali]KRN10857.1 hypothetical protein FD00_GL002100 [Liquorilactobacillus mali KCTC 3596 = DSM 20444]
MTVLDDLTLKPIKYLDFKKSTNEKLVEVMKGIKTTRLLLCKKQIAYSSYKQTYSNFESVAQEICKTNKMVLFGLGKQARKDAVLFFVLDYNFDGEPLELMYGELQKQIVYAQTINDYVESKRKAKDE